jgi:hypothetical protein
MTTACDHVDRVSLTRSRLQKEVVHIQAPLRNLLHCLSRTIWARRSPRATVRLTRWTVSYADWQLYQSHRGRNQQWSFTYINTVGTSGIGMLTYLACLMYWYRDELSPETEIVIIITERRLTFNPIHRIVPTSPACNGLNNLSTVAFSPVGSPALRMESPE